MVSVGDRKQIANDLKDEGNSLMAKGQYTKALKMYTRAIDEDDTNAVLYTNRSAAFFSTKQYKESLEDAEKALSIDNTWWKAYKRKGMSLCHLRKFEDAVKAFEAGLAKNPGNEELLKGLEFAKACLDQSQHLYVLPKPQMMQRLDGVPTFYVADSAGQPFFVTYEDGQQICTFYFEYSEAEATLKWIQDENASLGTTASIVPVSLSQALFLAQETQQNQYVEELQAIMLGGTFPLAFQFRPELKQVEFAIERLKAMPQDDAATAVNGEKKDTENKEKDPNAPAEEELTVENFNGIPVFQAKGLTLLQDNHQYVPLFLARHDLESSWEQLQEMGIGEIPPTCEIDVGTLEDVLKRMAESETGEFDTVIFVPNSHMRKHVNDDFPMDELTKSQKNPQRFAAAKAIKMAGGTQDDIRKAIMKEIAKNADKQKYAEVFQRHNIPVSVVKKDKDAEAAGNASGASAAKDVA
eukprot:CAMPEP_0184694398 /NCGR_PEP_ID=MMETSP0313-20130426/2379_1 /TAXON_ID=2792 /ORGANISM="Porphyridium aerugineum, Strain SAG 1380-2" /LENGTH=466 /DNA_ID=CAMNT_0027152689 /DNA_START=291 /DNA_END=1691 /DNA_ORIENTATION=-